MDELMTQIKQMTTDFFLGYAVEGHADDRRLKRR